MRIVKRIINSIAGALEILGCLVLNQKFLEETDRFYQHPEDLGDYETQNKYVHFLDAEFFDFIERYLDSIGDLAGFDRKGTMSSKRDVVVEILRNVPKIVALQQTAPATEPELNRALFPFFSIALSDAENDQRGVTFRKGGSVYKPDLTIPSLHCCVEYKYANDDREFAKELDQLVEDVHNFGDRHYNSFIGMMYTAGKCYKQEHEFLNLINRKTFQLPRRSQWEFLLVQGSGGRIVRKAAKAVV